MEINIDEILTEFSRFSCSDCKNCSYFGCTENRKCWDAIDDATHLLNKYRWHDLRKDPNDLPTEHLLKLVVVKLPDGLYSYRISDYVDCLEEVDDWYFAGKAKGGWYSYDNEYGFYEETNVIAWKYEYIEPFEEEISKTINFTESNKKIY